MPKLVHYLGYTNKACCDRTLEYFDDFMEKMAIHRKCHSGAYRLKTKVTTDESKLEIN